VNKNNQKWVFEGGGGWVLPHAKITHDESCAHAFVLVGSSNFTLKYDLKQVMVRVATYVHECCECNILYPWITDLYMPNILY